MKTFIRGYSEALVITFFLLPTLLFMNRISTGLGAMVILVGVPYLYRYVGGSWLFPDFSFIWEDSRFYIKVAAVCYTFFLAILWLPKFL